MSGAQKQVEAAHYFRREYDTPWRFASYWHQTDLALAHGAKTVLEIGPGNGFLSDYLRRAGLSVTTIDPDLALRPSAAAALPHLPFSDKSFDLVACFEVLEHIPFDGLPACLAEIKRVSSAHVAISLPDVERILKVDTTLSKVWHIHFLLQLPRLIRPVHRFNGEHHWEIGKRGYPAGRVLEALAESGMTVRRHWRAFETPYHHFFDVAR